MSHPVSQDREFQADRLAEAIACLWIDASRQQTEAAAMLSRVVVHDEPRIPNEHEVRGFLRGAVRGSLMRTPPPPRKWWQKASDFLFRWDDE
jgi:hypothetical protein